MISSNLSRIWWSFASGSRCQLKFETGMAFRWLHGRRLFTLKVEVLLQAFICDFCGLFLVTAVSETIFSGLYVSFLVSETIISGFEDFFLLLELLQSLSLPL